MRRKSTTILLLLAALAAAVFVAGCEDEAEGTPEAIEGEPLELGELLYNVQITRFLNPDSLEDQAYLRDQEPPDIGEDYLGVFIKIQNESDEPQEIPDEFPIVDTRGNTFEALESDSDFALMLGAEVPPDATLPLPDTPAASGSIKGSLLLYLINEEAVANLPLKLEVEGPDGEVGEISLDI